MNQSQARYLTAAERTLVNRTVPRSLATLDEDELVTLHDRVRRATTKYRTLYRRQAASKVRQQRSRGKASGANEGTAIKAEVFEEALSRVSAALAKAARASAKELKAERLAAARTGSTRPARPAARGRASASKSAAPSRARGRGAAASTRTPASVKRRAATQATGARRQAKRDTR